MKKKIKYLVYFLIAGFIIANSIAITQAYSISYVKNVKSKDNKVGIIDIITGVDVPRAYSTVTPDRDFKTVKIFVDEEKKKYLEGWFMEPQEDSKGLVILFHGFQAEKSSLLSNAYIYLELGYKVLLIDFMGTGNSYGNQTTVGYYEAKNVKEAYDYAVNTLGENRIILDGFSMGAVAIIKAVHDYNLQAEALILETPYGRLVEILRVQVKSIAPIAKNFSYLISFWSGIINKFNYFDMNPEEYVKKVTTPSLFLNGEKDNRVSVEEAERIFKNSGSSQKELKTFSETEHESGIVKHPEEWKTVVSNFLNSKANNLK